MQLLEHVTMATTPTAEHDQDVNVHVITGVWDPRETSFAVLNKETPQDLNSVYLTIAADLGEFLCQIIYFLIRFCSKSRLYTYLIV